MKDWFLRRVEWLFGMCGRWCNRLIRWSSCNPRDMPSYPEEVLSEGAGNKLKPTAITPATGGQGHCEGQCDRDPPL